MNQEVLYQAIHNEEWGQIIDTLYKKKNEIKSDSMLHSACQIFEDVFIQKMQESSASRNVELLEKLYILHEGNYYKLKSENHKTLILEILRRQKNTNTSTYNYAKLYPKEAICVSIIRDYEKNTPKAVEHSQNHLIHLSENRNIDDVDYRTILFKSNQEKQFFLALKQIFDSYQIYPNVAVSCLLDWELIKYKLDKKEKDYFFKCIIDFVVFDQAEDYLPIHFFELDSDFHDSDIQKAKDSLKDSIFSKAGMKIRRIRKMDLSVGEEKLIKLIREILNQP